MSLDGQSAVLIQAENDDGETWRGIRIFRLYSAYIPLAFDHACAGGDKAFEV